MRFIVVICLGCVPLFAFPQFSDSVTHQLKINCNGILNQTADGNSYVLSNTLNYNVLKKTLALNTAANWVYGENRHAVSNNDLTTHADLNFFKPGKKLSYWVLLNFDKIYSLGILYRAQGGGGVSYNFIDSTHLRINISDGLLYEAGDIKTGDAGNNSYATTRNSLRLLLRWKVKDKLTVTSTHFYQPSLQSFKDYIIQSTTNVSIKLYQRLSLNANLAYNKATNTHRDNLLLTYGVVFDTFF